MNKIALIIAAAGVAGFSGAAFAQGTSPTFEQADTDHDGFVGLAEAQAAFPGLTENQFKNADSNKDDKLSADEYASLSPVSPTQNSNDNNNANSSAATVSGASSAATSSQASTPGNDSNN